MREFVIRPAENGFYVEERFSGERLVFTTRQALLKYFEENLPENPGDK